MPAQTKTTQQTPAATGTNGLAVASFILSIIGLGIIGVIFGIIAITQINKRGQAGKGLAIAGIIIGIITGLISIVVLTSDSSSTTYQIPSTTNGTAKTEAPATKKQVAEAPPPEIKIPTITAQKLYADYSANQISADKTYKGKEYKITGTIDDFGTELFGAPYVSLVGDGYFNTIRCGFSKDQSDAISKLNKGQSVTFQGTVDGDLIGSVSVKDCSIVK